MCEFNTGDLVLCSDNGENWTGEMVYLFAMKDGEIACQYKEDWECGCRNIYKWKYAKPLLSYEERILNPVRMMQWLVEHGWTVDSSGGWRGTGQEMPSYFNSSMWECCGKTVDDRWGWRPEWIEKVEIK